MKISPIQKQEYKTNFPSFTRWRRTAYAYNKGMIHRNDTHFFRETQAWLDFISFIDKKFKKAPKINVYNYGCSDGSDIFTLIMLLKNKSPKLLEKMSPIISKDYDPMAIEKAINNDYIMTIEEKICANCFINNYDDFFIETEGSPDYGENVKVKVNPELYKHTYFEKADVLKDYKNIDSDNTIVILRNLIPYLHLNKGGDWNVQREFFHNLYSQLGENAYIAVGDYDHIEFGPVLDTILHDAGFESTKCHNLYYRKPPKKHFFKL